MRYLSIIGPDGEMVMNPIPGEAGTDYPVYSEVPDTGFNCGQQQYPGIYTDLQADCQVCSERLSCAHKHCFILSGVLHV